jgi:hypothetical protein
VVRPLVPEINAKLFKMTVSASKDWIQQLYVREITKKSPEPDFYKDKNGNIVMTESFHMKRGRCCGNGCLHCPYEPMSERGNTNLNESLRK